MTTGEGGALSSINPELLEKAKIFSRQGLIRDKNKFKIKDQGPWHQEVQEFGLNYRLPDVLCALGVSQLARIQDFKSKRRSIFHHYQELLSNANQIQLPTERQYVEANWHLFPIKVDPQRRTEIFTKLRESGIGVQVNYIPAYWHPVFEDLGFKRGMFPESDKFYSQEISLPMHVGLSEKDINFISQTLLNCL